MNRYKCPDCGGCQHTANPHMIEINKIYNMDCLEGIANDRIRKALAEKAVGE